MYHDRYLGLPVMLRAGEYSPNNPLVRGERAPGDVLLGLGEYERQRNTLRRIRQQQYREYLDQQSKKKQEVKEQSERERREREEREREHEQRERELLLERDRRNEAERRRGLDHVPVTSTVYCANKVDTGVQVDGFARPLSVAVQTDEAELFQLSPSPSKSQLTQAERELSPRSAEPALQATRRRSYGDFDERSSTLVKRCSRDKLTSELRHSYMPSIFDADAIRLRNLQVEKEAAERRQYYQQELKNQILEQQRIREERKTREKMLEQAEMRRLEEQLRMLRVAQDRERGKQHDISAAMIENTTEYNNKRTELQKEIDEEQHKLLRITAKPTRNIRRSLTRGENHSNLPLYYPKTHPPTTPEWHNKDKKPYSMNIPDNSIFSPNYDVDTYLRRNLNFNKDKLVNNLHTDTDICNEKSKKEEVLHRSKVTEVIGTNAERSQDRPLDIGRPNDKYVKNTTIQFTEATNNKDNSPKQDISNTNDVDNTQMRPKVTERPLKNGGYIDRPNKPSSEIDSLPIPVLKHTPSSHGDGDVGAKLSVKMKIVDDKWKVPAVQKNILKCTNEEGKNVSILTQLGSIRRQLQLEQLKLDRMLLKDDS